MRISDWSSDVCSSDLVPSLWRILVPAREGEDDETLLSDAKKNRVFAGLLGDDRPITTYHRTLYRVHQRVAHDFRKGRVILAGDAAHLRSEEHTSELQSLMRISYAVFCLKKKIQ